MQFVILGAGYAGLRAALDLDRLLRERGTPGEVTLVDQFSYHQIVQVLHLAATAAIHSREAICDLAPLLVRTGVRFVQGKVTRIAPLERTLTFADGQQLSYDRLALALGAETDYHDVPGAQEHTFALRTYEQALALREHIIAQFTAAAQTSDPQARRILMTTALVGGGYTGCQVAGELAAWAEELCESTGAPRQEVRIALVDQAQQLLGQFGPWATREAEQVLDSMGVSVYTGTGIDAVEPQLLRVSGGRILRAATIIWAGGVRGPDVLADSGLPVNHQGRVLVDHYLRVQDQALMFAMGDCAAIPDQSKGEYVPATASYAMRQGSHMAQSLLAEAEGRAPRGYDPLHLGEIISLGPKYAIGNPLGVRLTGYSALLMKKGIEHYYRGTLDCPSSL